MVNARLDGGSLLIVGHRDRLRQGAGEPGPPGPGCSILSPTVPCNRGLAAPGSPALFQYGGENVS
jgi:hypothetical protein